jgi:hypothetical protein
VQGLNKTLKNRNDHLSSDLGLQLMIHNPVSFSGETQGDFFSSRSSQTRFLALKSLEVALSASSRVGSATGVVALA